MLRMKIDSIHNIAVCGAGTMGAGIAQVAATAGFFTILFDVNEAVLKKAQQQIEQQWQNAVAKNKISSDQYHQLVGKLRYTRLLSDCRAAVVIEAIVEKQAAKEALFRQLASMLSPQTIFASNTSSLSITQLAQTIPYPERVAGMHFFNPAPVMKLVEIVQGENTSAAVVEVLHALAEKMGKVPVRVKDTPGFIVNRVARHYYLESLKIAEEGTADYQIIDRLLEATGFRMGPFALMDLIGNDINLAVTQSLYEAFRHAPRFRPSILQQQKVQSGELGRKTGKGFYEYFHPGSK